VSQESPSVRDKRGTMGRLFPQNSLRNGLFVGFGGLRLDSGDDRLLVTRPAHDV
jgi:hypothetical protein